MKEVPCQVAQTSHRMPVVLTSSSHDALPDTLDKPPLYPLRLSNNAGRPFLCPHPRPDLMRNALWTEEKAEELGGSSSMADSDTIQRILAEIRCFPGVKSYSASRELRAGGCNWAYWLEASAVSHENSVTPPE
ncbi:hypothetical protein ANO11243_067340 [Dothideomycetidae sp. 11243]|nr:hypothetical protein ANO11243_067340 [fungal sp. No.11243]